MGPRIGAPNIEIRKCDISAFTGKKIEGVSVLNQILDFLPRTWLKNTTFLRFWVQNELRKKSAEAVFSIFFEQHFKMHYVGLYLSKTINFLSSESPDQSECDYIKIFHFRPYLGPL